MTEVDCIWPVGALLGEGPLWSAAEEALWFTDIKGRRLHRYTPATAARASFAVAGEAGFIVPAEAGGFIIGMDNGLHRFDGQQVTGRVAALDAHPGTRINDGTVAPDGRIWFGTMDIAEAAPTGALHTHDDAGTCQRLGPAAVVTNGPAISRDGRRLYFVDTVGGLIWRYAIEHGRHLHDGEIFARIDPSHGYPDGVTIDAEDCLWVALWGGGGVRRYDPDGALIAFVALPTSNVTKLAFGGRELRTAFVTTARAGLSPEDLRTQPLAGGLFAFDPLTTGVPAHAARCLAWGSA